MDNEHEYNTKDHDLNEIWSHLSEGQKERSDIKSDVSALTSDINGIKNQLSDVVTLIRQLAAPTKTNWGWLIAAIVLLGSFIALYVMPVQRQTEANTKALLRVVEMAHSDRINIENRLSTNEEWIRLKDKNE